MAVNYCNQEIKGTLTTTGNITSGGSITMPDYIYHTGDTNTYFGFQDQDQWSLTVGGDLNMFADADGVYLYHNASQKFRTTSTGVYITGGATTTASSTFAGANVTADFTWSDSIKATFGASNDLEIYHDGSNSYIKETGTGNLLIQGSTQVNIGGTNGEIGIQYVENAGVGLRHNNVNKLSTSSTGISVTGGITTTEEIKIIDSSATGSPKLSFYQTTNERAYIQYADSGEKLIIDSDADLVLNTNNTARLTIDSNGDVTVSGGDITLGGTGRIQGIDTVSSGTDAANKTYVDNAVSGAGSGTFLPLAGGTMTGDVTFNDNEKLKLGTSPKTSIYNDGTDTYIQQTSGNLYLFQDANDKDIIFSSDDGSGGTTEYFKLDGSAVKILMQKSTVFSGGGMDYGIDGAGADVIFYGDTSGRNMKWDQSEDHLLFTDNTKLKLGTSGDLEIYHDGSHSYIQDSGTGVLKILSSGVTFQNEAGSSNILVLDSSGNATFAGQVTIPEQIYHTGDSNTYFGFHNNDEFRIVTGGTERLEASNSGIKLGSSGSTVNTILDEDNMASNSATALATQQSIKAYVDSSTTGVLTYQGTWNADTNSPTLSSGSGTPGYYYIVSTAGTTDLDGITDWQVGDWAVFSDQATDAWQKIDNTQVGNVSGSGTIERLAKWSGSGTLANSIITDDGSDVSVAGDVSMVNGNATGKFAVNNASVHGSFDFYNNGNSYFNGAVTIDDTFTQSGGGASSFSGNLTVSGTSSTFNTGNSGTFITNDSSNYPRFTMSGASAQIGLFRAGSNAGGMYIGGAGDGFRLYTAGFSQKLLVDQSGNATFAGNVTLNSRLTFEYNGSGTGNNYIETGTNTISFKSSAGTTIISANFSTAATTFAGDVTVGDELTITTIGNATADPDKFLCASGANKVGYRTGAQVLSDIGAAPATGGAYLPLAGGTMTGDVKFNDNVDIKLGTSNDCTLTHNGTDTFIDNGTGDLNIRNQTNNGDINFICDNGSGGVATYFFLDGSETRVTFNKNARFVDSALLELGTSGDLQIFHNSTDSVIDNLTGDLYITNKSDDKDIIFRSDDGSGGFATYFFLDGSQADGTYRYIDFPDNSVISLGDNDAAIYHDGTDTRIKNETGDLFISQFANDKDIVFRSDDGSGGVATYFFLDGSGTNGSSVTGATVFPDASKIYLGTGKDMEIFHNGSQAYIENYTGEMNFTQHVNDGDMIFKCDDGSGGVTEYFRVDGGTERVESSKSFRFADSARAQFGDLSDLQIYHDASNSYITNATGDLYIQGNGDDVVIQGADDVQIKVQGGEVSANFGGNGGVDLYHNNSVKFNTTSNGIEVTGKTDTDTLLIGTSTEVDAILDEDNMASNSATSLATQQSIKAYVDAISVPTVNNSTITLTAGTGLTGSSSFTLNQASNQTITFSLSVNSLSTSTTAGDADFFIVGTTMGAEYKMAPANIALSHFNNDSGWTTNTGTVTSVSVGTGLDISNSTTTPSITMDLTELTLGSGLDATATGLSLDFSEFVSATADEVTSFIVYNSGDTQPERLLVSNVHDIDAYWKYTPVIFNGSFNDGTSSTSTFYIPIAGSTSETTSSQEYQFAAMPFAGRVRTLMMQNTGTTPTTTNSTRFKIYKNGSLAYTSSYQVPTNGGSVGAYIKFDNINETFSVGDRIQFAYNKQFTSDYWRDVAFTAVVEFQQM